MAAVHPLELAEQDGVWFVAANRAPCSARVPMLDLQPKSPGEWREPGLRGRAFESTYTRRRFGRRTASIERNGRRMQRWDTLDRDAGWAVRQRIAHDEAKEARTEEAVQQCGRRSCTGSRGLHLSQR